MKLKLLVIMMAVLILAAAGLSAAAVSDAKKIDTSDNINLDDSLDVSAGDGNVDPANIDKAQYASPQKLEPVDIGPGISQLIADTSKANIGISVFNNPIEAPSGYIDEGKMNELKKQISAPVVSPEDIANGNALSSALIQAPGLVRSFEGIQQTAWMPPDPHIAAGPNHIGLVVNSRFEFYNKNGVSLTGSDFGVWYNSICPGCFIFDPRIVYDYKEKHWLMVALTYKTNPQESWYLLSVSKTADPSAGWWLYKLPGAVVFNGVNTFADYPDIGFDGISSTNGGAIYLTSNQFGFTGPFQTAMLTIVKKSSIYTGAAAISQRFVGFTDASGQKSTTLRTAVTYGNPNNLEFLINSNWAGGNAVTIWQANPIANTVSMRATVPTLSYSIPPNARQPCSYTLDTIDNRIYNAVYMNSRLYAGFNDKTSSNEVALHYLRINLVSNTAERDIKYGQPGYDIWFPAVGVDINNNVSIVFARSGPNEYAGIRYSGHKPAETALQPSALLKAGAACYTSGRWGDYFGASIDPSVPTAVWIYGEWAKGTNIWGTWVGATKYP